MKNLEASPIGREMHDVKSDFIPAKTIEEAKEYAKRFCEPSMMARTFKGEVDYKGISLENANRINKALTDAYNNISLEKLSGIKVVSPTSPQGKKAFKDGANAVFSYSPIEHGIFVNKDVLKSIETFEQYTEKSKEAWNTVMNNIDKLSGAQKELALKYKTAGRSLVNGDTVEGLFTHELGHHAQWTLFDAKTNNSIGGKMSNYATKISGYANASKGEYFAESFSAYMKGEKHLLDPEFTSFLDGKIIDNGAGNGIIKTEVKNGNIRIEINAEKQARHIKGEPEYKDGNSYLTISKEKAQNIINEKSGTGKLVFDKRGNWKKKELIDCDKEIGVDVDVNTHTETPTDKATIHYSKTGTHLVPRKGEEKRT